ncbi:MAG: HipA domain-containing protein [Bacteroidota bacterium]
MINRRCLYCYKELNDEGDFHTSCSRSFFESIEPPLIDFTIDQMVDLAKHVVEKSVSVPGFQPKLSMSMVREIEDKGRFRLTVVGALGGNYILKPPTVEYPELPQNEHVTMRIAGAFGIKNVPSSLIRLKSGELSYVTRRIDRTKDGSKIHMIDMFQILEAFDKYKGSYEKVGKAVGLHSANSMLDKLLYFELVVFCYLTGNSDMHLKNFSMIETNSGWILAPAYDLLNVAIVLPSDEEEVALALSGKRSNLTRKAFDRFGMGMGLNQKQVQGVYSRFERRMNEARKLIDLSFLSDNMKGNYLELFNSRCSRMGLADEAGAE